VPDIGQARHPVGAPAPQKTGAMTRAKNSDLILRSRAQRVSAATERFVCYSILSQNPRLF
jgi:hypothetical protein